MEQYLTWEYFTLWCALSIMILILWALMIGDGGTSKTSNIIVTIICSILGFPIFLLILVIILISPLFIKRNKL